MGNWLTKRNSRGDSEEAGSEDGENGSGASRKRQRDDVDGGVEGEGTEGKEERAKRFHRGRHGDDSPSNAAGAPFCSLLPDSARGAATTRTPVPSPHRSLASVGGQPFDIDAIEMPLVAVSIDGKETDEEEIGWETDDDDPLGYRGDSFECTRNFSASIWLGSEADGHRVGSLQATLVDRPSPFHAACDAGGSELQEFGCLLFGSSGKPRHQVLKSDPEARRGGFLYIRSLDVNDGSWSAFAKERALAFAMAAHPRLGEACVFGPLLSDVVQRIVERSLRRTELGAAAVHALLIHPMLEQRWTVAAYICDMRTGWPRELVDADRDFHLELAQVQGRARERTYLTLGSWPGQRPGETPAAARLKSIKQGKDADARKFVRAGFKELDYTATGGWLYISKSMHRRAWQNGKPVITHAQALGVPLRASELGDEEEDSREGAQRNVLVRLLAAGKLVDMPARIIQGMMADMDRKAAERDEELLKVLEAVGRERISSSPFDECPPAMVKVDELVSAGADLDRACVLHFCAANRMGHLFKCLVDRGADVNALDRTGVTPLQIAAASAVGAMSGQGDSVSTDSVQTLVSLGADISKQDKEGLTALGHFYLSVRNLNDYYRTFETLLPREKIGLDPGMQAVLMPPAGPSSSDCDYLSSDDSDDWD